MNATFKIDVQRPVKFFDGIANKASKPDPILKRWGGYFIATARKRADAAEGWPSLKASTVAKYTYTRTSKITSWGGVRTTYASKLEGYLKGQAKKGSATADMDLKELARLRAGGRVSKDDLAWGGSAALARLRKTAARAQAQRDQGKKATAGGKKRKIAGVKLLGRAARQITFLLAGTKVTALSKVPFAGVHNEGGTSGNDATQPKREFLSIRSKDQVLLSSIALEHFLK